MIIPLIQYTQNDALIWIKEPSGIYSVKAAYKLLQEQKGNWREDDINLFWKIFWKLQIPPKVKDTVWRACSNCLPTRQQLMTKRVEVPLECPMCHLSSKSIGHCLISCPIATWVWTRVAIAPEIDENSSFAAWF